jgi:hypothetical protein
VLRTPVWPTQPVGADTDFQRVKPIICLHLVPRFRMGAKLHTPIGFIRGAAKKWAIIKPIINSHAVFTKL